MSQKSWGFPKQLRLLNAQQYKDTFKTGKKHSVRFFALYAKANALPYPRLGLVVPKKAAKRAIARNLIKRISRESFRLNQHALDGFDYVLTFYPGINTLDKQILRQLIDQQWAKLISCKKSY